ncbi:MAG: MFS transporter [Candidatus Thorarchaeota archaeon]
MENEARQSDWTALKSVYNSAFLCSLGFFFVSFIIPIAAYDPNVLGATGFQVALVFALLTLGSAIFSPIAGRIVRGGKRREAIFFGSSIRALAYIGMSASFLIGSIDFLILNSLVWGMGAGFYLVGSDAEISERVTRQNRAEAFGKRSATNAQGQILGTFIGFTIFFITDIYTVFLFYAAMNILGGLIVYLDKRPFLLKVEALKETANRVLGLGIAALIFAAAIDAFVLALLSPFVELYIFESFTTEVDMVALLYLPGGILTAILGGKLGRLADRSNQVAIVAGSALVVSLTTFILAFLPILVADIPNGMFLVAPLFALENVAAVAAYTVMSSVLGTAYEGRAAEGFGKFEAVIGLSRFMGPLVGGVFWDTIGPMSPFIFVGFIELLLIPAYYIGIKQYQKALQG